MPRFALVFPAMVLALSVVIGGVPPSRVVAQDATPAGCAQTSEEDNEATAVLWHEEVINAGNLDLIDEIVAPDVVHHAGTFPDGQGPDAIKSVLGGLLIGFPDVHHTVAQVISDDDMVVTVWSAVGTNDGEFQGHAPTGKEATWSGVNVFRFDCGLIVEEWSEVDGLGRLQQLELLAPPAP